MALAAAVLAPGGDSGTPVSVGSLWMQMFTLAFSANYPTGGEPWDPIPAFSGPAPAGVLTVDIDGGPGYTFEYDKVNKKLKLFSSVNTELAAGAYNAALTGDGNIIAKVYAK